MHKRSGFTLIEISIVLVIIGLVTAGVLVGQMLIRNAEIRKTLKQREAFDTAANTFRVKYNCLPGDCGSAFTLGLASGPNGSTQYGEAGNDNNMIGGLTDSELYSETPAFWYHLAQARLINWTPPSAGVIDLTITCEPNGGGPCLAHSATAADGHKAGWWVHSTYSGRFISNADAPYASGNYLWITGTLGNAAPSGSAVFIPVDAYDLDRKIDDGMPLTGTVLATGDVPSAVYGPGDPSVGAIDMDNTCAINIAPPRVYNVNNTTRNAASMCGLLIKGSF